MTHENFDVAIRTLQNQFDKIIKWSHDNGLVINANKTKVMHIKPPRSPAKNINIIYNPINCDSNCDGNCDSNCDSICDKNNGNISLNNCDTICDKNMKNICDNCKNKKRVKLELVEQIKYLGVIVDNKLKWDKHIFELKKKLRKSSYALYHLSNLGSKEILLQVYYSLAESYLRFGITSWGTSSCCKELQKSQNKLIKLLNSKGETVKIMTIEELYQMTMINTYYDSKNFFKPIDHAHSTRGKTNGKYKVPKFLNNHAKKTLQCTLPSIFNTIPQNLINLPRNPNRKLIIKKYFKNNYTQ